MGLEYHCSVPSSNYTGNHCIRVTPSPNNNEDSMYWELSSSGNFSIKSTYQYLNNEVRPQAAGTAKLIWKWQGPQRMKMFL